MLLNRYDHQTVKNLIYGYMSPSPSNPLESREDEFNRAKVELVNNLSRRIDQVEAFSFSDLAKKVS